MLTCRLKVYLDLSPGGPPCPDAAHAAAQRTKVVDATAFMATVGTQLTAFAPHYNDCPSLQHSGSSSPAQLALFANPLQDTISMLHEGLAVSPTVNQSHVGFLGVATPS
ncbi:TPA: hypothetical protein ACH3X3_004608 [Trebouxia sp. C0006]